MVPSFLTSRPVVLSLSLGTVALGLLGGALCLADTLHCRDPQPPCQAIPCMVEAGSLTIPGDPVTIIPYDLYKVVASPVGMCDDGGTGCTYFEGIGACVKIYYHSDDEDDPCDGNLDQVFFIRTYSSGCLPSPSQ